MAGLEAPLMVAWQACGRDEGGGGGEGKEEGTAGAQLRGAARGGAPMEGGGGLRGEASWGCFLRARLLLFVGCLC
jgi:hypothetical protein